MATAKVLHCFSIESLYSWNSASLLSGFSITRPCFSLSNRFIQRKKHHPPEGSILDLSFTLSSGALFASSWSSTQWGTWKVLVGDLATRDIYCLKFGDWECRRNYSDQLILVWGGICLEEFWRNIYRWVFNWEFLDSLIQQSWECVHTCIRSSY